MFNTKIGGNKKGQVFYQIFIFLFGMFFLFFGLGIGFIITLTFCGLIGGLLGLLAFNNKVLNIPNQKVAIFIGYIALIMIFVVLPFLFIILSMLPSYSSSYSYSSSSNPLIFMLTFLTIPFIHCVLTIGVFVFLENTKKFNSNYFQFLTAYFLATLILAPFTMIFGFLGVFNMFGSFGSSTLIPRIF